ncbi:MAG: DUF4368 domain-containing protein [Coprococcus sp.]
MAVTKTHPIKSTLKAAIDYILNPEKTDGKLLASSFGCGLETADIEFAWTREAAGDRGTHLGRHLIQSFAVGETTPEEVSEADMETTNVSKLIAVTKKYTRIDELTPEILNAFVDKIVIHEREKKDGKRTQQIDIYYSYVGIVDIPTDEEMREMEREYMQRTTRQTA